MRAFSGVYKMRGYYKIPRTTFKGDNTHKALATNFFRWVDDVRKNFNITDKYTTNGFLEILINTRWVIL